MRKKILVTGVNGFVGHHVAALLRERGHKILGIGNQPTLQNDLNGIVDDYVSCDLTDEKQVSDISLANVNAIINLAGFANVGGSKGQGNLYNKVNVGVHAVLYEECLRQKIAPRIIAISTGAVYSPSQTLPITEESVLIAKNKTNEYVISKQLMEEAVRRFSSRGLKCIIVRPFNHSGPGQLPGFLLPDLGEQIEKAAANNRPLMVGNLDTKRDYTDVRDVARAYVDLATCDAKKLNHDTYNVCSGESVSGTKILSLLKTAFGAQDTPSKIDKSKIRDNEVMDIYGSRDRLTADINWKPTISIKKMVDDFVAWKKSF